MQENVKRNYNDILKLKKLYYYLVFILLSLFNYNTNCLFILAKVCVLMLSLTNQFHINPYKC